MSLLTLVDSHLVRHRARSTDVMGQTLCGWPPVGVLLTDPAPNLDPRAKYVEKCGPCEAVAQDMGADDSVSAVLSRGSVPGWMPPLPTPKPTPRRGIKRFLGKGGAIPAERGDHVHDTAPDPLTAPWSELVEKGN